MNDSGFIKLHRTILDWEWIDDANTFRFWIQLLCTVNWDESRYKGITVGPGQRIASLPQLKEEMPGLTENNIRTAKKHLISTGEITVQHTRYGDLITVENWAKYQGRDAEAHRQSHSPAHREPTGDPQGTHRPIEEEIEEYKNNINSARTPAHAHTRDAIKEETFDVDRGHEIADGLWVPDTPPKTDEEKRANYYKVIETWRNRNA